MCLLHTIGKNHSRMGARSVDGEVHFSQRRDTFHAAYQCRGGIAAGGGRLAQFWSRLRQTLMAWFHNFDRAWEQLRDHYSDTFYRMWKYYLLSCRGLSGSSITALADRVV